MTIEALLFYVIIVGPSTIVSILTIMVLLRSGVISGYTLQLVQEQFAEMKIELLNSVDSVRTLTDELRESVKVVSQVTGHLAIITNYNRDLEQNGYSIQPSPR